MKKNGNGITELVFILDASGSMHHLTQDTIGGFNGLVEKQKKQEGTCLVTTVLFNGESRTVHDRLPLAKVPPMTEEDYTASGCTALLDALGGTIEHIAGIHRYARREDVPEHTLFVITTDGMENASRRYGADKVRSLVAEKKEQGWEFLFLAANIDAVETARSMNIDADRAVNYRADEAGTRLVYACLAEAVRDVRASRKLNSSWGAKVERDHRERK